MRWLRPEAAELQTAERGDETVVLRLREDGGEGRDRRSSAGGGEMIVRKAALTREVGPKK